MTPFDSTELSGEQRQRLLYAAIVAGCSFIFALAAGALAGSQAVIADGLDFAGLAVASGLSLGFKDLPPAMRAGARLVSTALLGLLAIAVALATLHAFLTRLTPEPGLMAAAALTLLAANGTILYLLRNERSGTGVLRDVWFAVRNDLVGSGAVMIAAGVVVLVDNAVPDLTVAGVIVVLFIVTLVPELRTAMAIWDSNRTGNAEPASEPPAGPEAP